MACEHIRDEAGNVVAILTTNKEPEEFSRDRVVAVGFGSSGLFRDGECVIDGEERLESDLGELTGEECERIAAADPDRHQRAAQWRYLPTRGSRDRPLALRQADWRVRVTRPLHHAAARRAQAADRGRKETAMLNLAGFRQMIRALAAIGDVEMHATLFVDADDVPAVLAVVHEETSWTGKVTNYDFGRVYHFDAAGYRTRLFLQVRRRTRALLPNEYPIVSADGAAAVMTPISDSSDVLHVETDPRNARVISALGALP